MFTPSKVGSGAWSVNPDTTPDAIWKPAPPHDYLNSSVPLYAISEEIDFKPEVRWWRISSNLKSPSSTFLFDSVIICSTALPVM